MYNDDEQGSDHLDDTQLLAREQDERADFRRLEQEEPHFRDTTYGVVHGSPALIESWERWWRTNLAARMRGIMTRALGR
jgi:hypothetical protein